MNEMLLFDGNVSGMVQSLSEKQVGVVFLDNPENLKAGSKVVRTERVLDVPVGDALLGRIINPVGKPLDNKSQSDFEEEKKKKLKEYREMILKEKKESRDKQLLKTNQDNVLDGQLTEEEKRKFLLRKELANKLKKNNTKFNSES